MATMVRECWSCRAQISPGDTLCKICSKIQPYPEGTDYFECMGLQRRLQLDLGDLERRFYDLSRRFHPDFYYGKDEAERTISLENSALLNKAYRTLKDPFIRVEYLILLEEGGKNSIAAKVPQEFLEEVFELQEALEKFRSESNQQTKRALEVKLQEACRFVESRLSDLEKQVLELFGRWDQLIPGDGQPDAKQVRKDLIQQMKELMSYRTYFRNLIEDIHHSLAGHSDRRDIRH